MWGGQLLLNLNQQDLVMDWMWGHRRKKSLSWLPGFWLERVGEDWLVGAIYRDGHKKYRKRKSFGQGSGQKLSVWGLTFLFHPFITDISRRSRNNVSNRSFPLTDRHLEILLSVSGQETSTQGLFISLLVAGGLCSWDSGLSFTLCSGLQLP